MPDLIAVGNTATKFGSKPPSSSSRLAQEAAVGTPTDNGSTVKAVDVSTAKATATAAAAASNEGSSRSQQQRTATPRTHARRQATKGQQRPRTQDTRGRSKSRKKSRERRQSKSKSEAVVMLQSVARRYIHRLNNGAWMSVLKQLRSHASVFNRFTKIRSRMKWAQLKSLHEGHTFSKMQRGYYRTLQTQLVVQFAQMQTRDQVNFVNKRKPSNRALSPTRSRAGEVEQVQNIRTQGDFAYYTAATLAKREMVSTDRNIMVLSHFVFDLIKKKLPPYRASSSEEADSSTTENDSKPTTLATVKSRPATRTASLLNEAMNGATSQKNAQRYVLPASQRLRKVQSSVELSAKPVSGQARPQTSVARSRPSPMARRALLRQEQEQKKREAAKAAEANEREMRLQLKREEQARAAIGPNAISRDQYFEFYHRVCRVLVPDYQFLSAEAMIELDWERDCTSKESMVERLVSTGSSLAPPPSHSAHDTRGRNRAIAKNVRDKSNGHKASHGVGGKVSESEPASNHKRRKSMNRGLGQRAQRNSNAPKLLNGRTRRSSGGSSKRASSPVARGRPGGFADKQRRMDLAAAERAALEENPNVMTREQFRKSLFTLVDVWTNSIAAEQYRIFLATLLVCILKYTGTLPMHPDAFAFRDRGETFCQLDHDAELNVPTTTLFRTFMRNVFGAPMAGKIIKFVECVHLSSSACLLCLRLYHSSPFDISHQKALLKAAAHDKELLSERYRLRKQLERDLNEQLKKAKERDALVRRQIVVEKRPVARVVAFGRSKSAVRREVGVNVGHSLDPNCLLKLNPNPDGVAEVLDNDPFAAKKAIASTIDRTLTNQTERLQQAQNESSILSRSSPIAGDENNESETVAADDPDGAGAPARDPTDQLSEVDADTIRAFCEQYIVVGADYIAERLIYKRLSLAVLLAMPAARRSKAVSSLNLPQSSSGMLSAALSSYLKKHPELSPRRRSPRALDVSTGVVRPDVVLTVPFGESLPSKTSVLSRSASPTRDGHNPSPSNNVSPAHMLDSEPTSPYSRAPTDSRFRDFAVASPPTISSDASAEVKTMSDREELASSAHKPEVKTAKQPLEAPESVGVSANALSSTTGIMPSTASPVSRTLRHDIDESVAAELALQAQQVLANPFKPQAVGDLDSRGATQKTQTPTSRNFSGLTLSTSSREKLNGGSLSQISSVASHEENSSNDILFTDSPDVQGSTFDLTQLPTSAAFPLVQGVAPSTSQPATDGPTFRPSTSSHPTASKQHHLWQRTVGNVRPATAPLDDVDEWGAIVQKHDAARSKLASPTKLNRHKRRPMPLGSGRYNSYGAYAPDEDPIIAYKIVVADGSTSLPHDPKLLSNSAKRERRNVRREEPCTSAKQQVVTPQGSFGGTISGGASPPSLKLGSFPTPPGSVHVSSPARQGNVTVGKSSASRQASLLPHMQLTGAVQRAHEQPASSEALAEIAPMPVLNQQGESLPNEGLSTRVQQGAVPGPSLEADHDDFTAGLGPQRQPPLSRQNRRREARVKLGSNDGFEQQGTSAKSKSAKRQNRESAVQDAPLGLDFTLQSAGHSNAIEPGGPQHHLILAVQKEKERKQVEEAGLRRKPGVAMSKASKQGAKSSKGKRERWRGVGSSNDAGKAKRPPVNFGSGKFGSSVPSIRRSAPAAHQKLPVKGQQPTPDMQRKQQELEHRQREQRKQKMLKLKTIQLQQRQQILAKKQRQREKQRLKEEEAEELQRQHQQKPPNNHNFPRERAPHGQEREREQGPALKVRDQKGARTTSQIQKRGPGTAGTPPETTPERRDPKKTRGFNHRANGTTSPLNPWETADH